VRKLWKESQILIRKVLLPALLIASIVTSVEIVSKWKFGDYLVFAFDLKVSKVSWVKVYYDLGSGFIEQETTSHRVQAKTYQRIKNVLPRGRVERIRIDPLARAGTFSIRNMTIEGTHGTVAGRIPLTELGSSNQILHTAVSENDWKGTTIASANDPYIIIDNSDLIQKLTQRSDRERAKKFLSSHRDELLKFFGTVFIICLVALYFKNRSSHQESI
jgi:hypothetical protein